MLQFKRNDHWGLVNRDIPYPALDSNRLTNSSHVNKPRSDPVVKDVR